MNRFYIVFADTSLACMPCFPVYLSFAIKKMCLPLNFRMTGVCFRLSVASSIGNLNICVTLSGVDAGRRHVRFVAC